MISYSTGNFRSYVAVFSLVQFWKWSEKRASWVNSELRINTATNPNVSSDTRLANMLAILFARESYHGLVYDTELLQR